MAARADGLTKIYDEGNTWVVASTTSTSASRSADRRRPWGRRDPANRRCCIERAKERGLPANKRKAPGRLVEGQVTTNWKQALEQLAIVYPDRINPHI